MRNRGLPLAGSLSEQSDPDRSERHTYRRLKHPDATYGAWYPNFVLLGQAPGLLASLKLDHERIRLVGRFVEAYLPLDPGETKAYNELMEVLPVTEKLGIDEILTYWERKGLEQGLEQGRKVVRNTIISLAEERFGSIGNDDARILEGLSFEMLQELAIAVVRVPNYEGWYDLLLGTQEKVSEGSKG